MIRRAHLLDLQIPDELSAGVVQTKHHDSVDEETLVPEELAFPIGTPFHYDEGRELVVAEHLEEVEHSFAHVRRVLHQGVQSPERVEGEDSEFLPMDLPVVNDHPFDEGE